MPHSTKQEANNREQVRCNFRDASDFKVTYSWNIDPGHF